MIYFVGDTDFNKKKNINEVDTSTLRPEHLWTDIDQLNSDDFPSEWGYSSEKTRGLMELCHVNPVGSTDLPKRWIHIIKASKGMGKTMQVKQFLSTRRDSQSMLAFSVRRTMATKLAQDFGFTSYLTEENSVNLRAHRHIVISMQSLHHLFYTETEEEGKPSYDILILDEFAALLSALIAFDTHTASLWTILDHFKWLLVKASTIIVTDADLKPWHILELKKLILGGEEQFDTRIPMEEELFQSEGYPPSKNQIAKEVITHFNWNKYIKDDAVYHIHNEDEIAHLFHDKYSFGDTQPVAFFTTNKQAAFKALELALSVKTHLKKGLQSVEESGLWYKEGATKPTIVVVTGDFTSKSEMMQVLKDPNNELAECELFIANTAASIGIDIQLTCFSHIYCYAAPQTCHYEEFCQLIQRIRHKQHVYIGISQWKEKGLLLSEDLIKNNILAKRKYHSWLYVIMTNTPLDYVLKGIKELSATARQEVSRALKEPNKHLLNIFVKDQLLHNLTNTNISSMIIKQLQREGRQVEVPQENKKAPGNSEAVTEFTESYKQSKKAKKAQQVQDILNAPQVTEKEAKTLLQTRSTLNNKKVAMLKKHEISSIFPDSLTSENINDFLSKRKREKLLNSMTTGTNKGQAISEDSCDLVHNGLEQGRNGMLKNCMLGRILKLAGLKDDMDSTTPFTKDSVNTPENLTRINGMASLLSTIFPAIRNPAWKKGDIFKTIRQVVQEMGLSLRRLQRKSKSDEYYLDRSKVDTIQTKLEQNKKQQEQEQEQDQDQGLEQEQGGVDSKEITASLYKNSKESSFSKRKYNTTVDKINQRVETELPNKRANKHKKQQRDIYDDLLVANNCNTF